MPIERGKGKASLLTSRKRTIEILAICVIFLLVGAYLDFADSAISENLTVDKQKLGEGETELVLTLEAEDMEEETYVLEIPEVTLTEEEAMVYLGEAIEEIEGSMYAEGEDANAVYSDLNLKETYCDGVVEAEWTSEDRSLITEEGILREEAISEAGSQTTLSVILTLQDYSAYVTYPIWIYPKELSKQELLMERISEYFSTQSQNTVLTLPTNIGGQAILWSEKKDYVLWKIALLEVITGIALRILLMEKEKRAKKSREDALREAYPEIVSKVAILLSSGMSLRQAWNSISARYTAKRQKIKEEQIAYEEVLRTNRAMSDGENEREALEGLARRTEIPEYGRLARIVIRNQEKGAGGLGLLLEEEAEAGFEERKRAARVKGEEATTRMLFPLLVMLVVVIAIVVAPAMVDYMG